MIMVPIIPIIPPVVQGTHTDALKIHHFLTYDPILPSDKYLGLYYRLRAGSGLPVFNTGPKRMDTPACGSVMRGPAQRLPFSQAVRLGRIEQPILGTDACQLRILYPSVSSSKDCISNS